jgi:hypothetical protein
MATKSLFDRIMFWGVKPKIFSIRYGKFPENFKSATTHQKIVLLWGHSLILLLLIAALTGVFYLLYLVYTQIGWWVAVIPPGIAALIFSGYALDIFDDGMRD